MRIFLLCSGLGNIQRGFETFAEECYAELAGDPRLELFLFAGGGASCGNRRALANVRRQSRLASRLSKLMGRPEYAVEQLTFGLSLLPHLYRLRPETVLFSDGTLGNLLWHFRRWSGMRFRLILSNGAPFKPPFTRWDCVQQVAPAHYEEALLAGEDSERHMLLPYAIKVPERLIVLGLEERTALRRQLNLPVGRRIVLSPGSRNRCHKRMDYLIAELSTMPEPRPYLLMVGEWHKETAEVERLAKAMLGEEGFASLTVPSSEMKNYYLSADAVVLASLSEGLARALLEATAYGLPCLVHDYPVTRFAVGEHAFYSDFTRLGGIASALGELRSPMEDPKSATLRHERTRRMFSWSVLRERYAELLLGTACTAEVADARC